MSFTMVDGHAHLHPCFDEGTFLNAAWHNFQRAGLPQGEFGALLIAEVTNNDPLRRLRDGFLAPGPWHRAESAETTSLRFDHDQGGGLIFIAGYQLVTREGLELLVVASKNSPRIGSLAETLLSAEASGGVCIVPWGFGKWWFRRGTIVQQLLTSHGKHFLLGDNGGRPTAAGRPRLLTIGESHNKLVLAGSDPLPLRSHVYRAGSFGSRLPGVIAPDAPADWIKSQLRGLDQTPQTFGDCRSLAGFVMDQTLLRLAKRGPKP